MKVKKTTISSGHSPISLYMFMLIFGLSVMSCQKDDSGTSAGDTGICLVEIDGNFEDVELDEGPLFLNGGNEGFTDAVLGEVKYPAEARENSIEGVCLVDYEITVLGMVDNIAILQDPGGGIGAATTKGLEVVTAGISFAPAILNSVPVRVKKQLKMTFKLEG